MLRHFCILVPFLLKLSYEILKLFFFVFSFSLRSLFICKVSVGLTHLKVVVSVFCFCHRFPLSSSANICLAGQSRLRSNS